ncbi:ferrous iron transport protein A [Desulfarculales bacterium]
MQTITLRHLAPGQSAVVTKVTIGGELGRRLRDMGLVPGTPLRVIGRAPLKDPVEIKLRGYNLTLRNNEADHIIMEMK